MHLAGFTGGEACEGSKTQDEGLVTCPGFAVFTFMLLRSPDDLLSEILDILPKLPFVRHF
jgi:hypothetical protein